MLRISSETALEGNATVILKLDGSVSGAWVNELRRACRGAMGSGSRPEHKHLVLDLAGVRFIDSAGIELFRELGTQRVCFSNPSAFVAEQLKEVSHDCQ
jgi:anti-anti-sigma regulatory factor